jgi:hypothetical protein
MEGSNLHFLAARLRAKIESLCKPFIVPTIQDDHPEEWHPTRKSNSTSAQTSYDIKIDQLTLQNHALERENGVLISFILSFMI